MKSTATDDEFASVIRMVDLHDQLRMLEKGVLTSPHCTA